MDDLIILIYTDPSCLVYIYRTIHLYKDKRNPRIVDSRLDYLRSQEAFIKANFT